MNILWISDFFLDEIPSGAEQVDDIIINFLRQKNDVVCVRSNLVKKKFLDSFDHIILSNFTLLPASMVDDLIKTKLSIIEHDHKYLRSRNPAVFKDFIAPQTHIINKKMYQSAQVVFCQSDSHKRCIADNLKIENLVSLKTSIWRDSDYILMNDLQGVIKNEKAAVVRSILPNKNTHLAELYCKRKDIEYDLISAPNWEEFVGELSKYSKLVFFPKAYESFCRLVAEARMLNLEVIANSNVPILAEEWLRSLKGTALIDHLKENKNNVLSIIEGHLNGG